MINVVGGEGQVCFHFLHLLFSQVGKGDQEDQITKTQGYNTKNLNLLKYVRINFIYLSHKRVF